MGYLHRSASFRGLYTVYSEVERTPGILFYFILACLSKAGYLKKLARVANTTTDLSVYRYEQQKSGNRPRFGDGAAVLRTRRNSCSLLLHAFIFAPQLKWNRALGSLSPRFPLNFEGADPCSKRAAPRRPEGWGCIRHGAPPRRPWARGGVGGWDGEPPVHCFPQQLCERRRRPIRLCVSTQQHRPVKVRGKRGRVKRAIKSRSRSFWGRRNAKKAKGKIS